MIHKINNLIKIVFIILIFTNFGFAEVKKYTIEQLIDNNYTNNVFIKYAERFKEKGIDIKKLSINDSSLTGSKKFLIKINKMILNEDINGIVNNFSENIEFTEYETAYYKKNDFLKSQDFIYFQQLFFKKEYLKKHKIKTEEDVEYNLVKYPALLDKILKKQNKEEKYFINIYAEKSNGKDLKYQIYNGIYYEKNSNNYLGFEIKKINKEWKITGIIYVI